MKLVIGIVRPEKTNDVLEALYRADVRGLTMTRVQGHGGELDRVETYRGTTVRMGLAEKTRIENQIAQLQPLVPQYDALVAAERALAEANIPIEPAVPAPLSDTPPWSSGPSGRASSWGN